MVIAEILLGDIGKNELNAVMQARLTTFQELMLDRRTAFIQSSKKENIKFMRK
ncbi:MAG: hypothetical protein AB1467_06665 [Candidatus Diapherotrites archaeon]